MPGVTVTITNAPAPASRPTDSGKLFAVGQCERGSTTAPTIVHSISEYKNKLGGNVAGNLQQYIETFFLEGGATAVIGRAVGSAAVTAKKLFKKAATTVLTISAKSPGAWGNKLTVQVIKEGTNYALKVFLSNELVEEKKELATSKAAQEWAEQFAEYVNIVSNAEENPDEIVATALENGSDGEALTTASYEAALALFRKDLGCGQVAAPGVTTTAVQEALLSHANERNRFALVDAVQGATKAELTTVATGLRTKTGARRAALYSTWATVAGTVPNTTRKVPWSVVQAGIIARNDQLTEPPAVNVASAGFRGRPLTVLNVTEFTRVEQNELNEGRVNAIRVFPNLGVEAYGNVTLVNPATEPPWEAITASRLFMFVIASGELILEQFVFAEIDPHGLLFAKAGSTLQAFLESLKEQLYNDPAQAVNVGNQVNTPETIKKHQLRAAIQVQPSPTAETVTLEITAQGV